MYTKAKFTTRNIMKLSNLTAKAIFSVAFVSILLTFMISIIFQFENFENEIQRIKKDYIELKKDEIKREVSKVFNAIDMKEEEIQKRLREKLIFRVNIAHEIATTIYNENIDKKSEDEIKYLIVAALRNISFSETRAYYFINSNKGKAVLFNKKSQLGINNNIWKLKDITGKYFIQEQAKIAIEKSEGFLQTHFVKPDLNDNIQYPKLSYIRKFRPFNWHIGMGEYIDDITNETKENLLKDIANTRFGKDGYIFVNSLNKKALVFDGNKLPTPKDYTNDFLYQKQINAIANKDGGFFFYKFKKLTTIKKYPKIAFVKKHDKWGWIIGSGIYIDYIDEEIQKRTEQHMDDILKQVSTVFLALLVLLIIIYIVSRKMSSYFDRNITVLIKSFKNASKKHQAMNIDEFTFDEFKTLGKSLNKTLKSRNDTEKKLQDYISIVNENVIISSTDTKGVITDASEAFCEISGYKKDEIIGKNHNIIRHEDMSKEFYSQMWNELKKGNAWQGEIKNKDKSGKAYWVKTIIKPIYKENKIIGYTSVKQNISDRKKVEYLSITDELTNLKNRRYFNQVIKDEINRAKRENNYLTFMMLDIDYFKKFNDTYGHQEGDNALKKLSSVLCKHTQRASDFAFRLGGEEFGIIFSSEDKKKSYDFANNIRKDIEKLKIEHKESKVSKFITASIGIIVKKGDEITSNDEIYKQADEALYEAKNSGRNKVVSSS